MITGVVSTIAFALLIAWGAVLSGTGLAAQVGIGLTLLGTIPMLLILIAVRQPRGRDRVARLLLGPLRLSHRMIHRPPNPHGWSRDLVERLGSYHLGRVDASLVMIFALSYWLLDAACLCATVAAFGQPVPWRFMFAIYAAGIGAAAVGFTPAGIGAAAVGFTPAGVGIAETAIASALTAGGISEFHALPTALVYRAISCWFVLAVGWVLFTRSRRHLRQPHRHAP